MIIKIAASGILFCLGIAFALGIIFLIWLLWSWVLPQLWSTGPANLITPNYWLFAGAWILFVTIAKILRGGKEK
jgi:hypothetical protein